MSVAPVAAGVVVVAGGAPRTAVRVAVTVPVPAVVRAAATASVRVAVRRVAAPRVRVPAAV
ncbi:hypothetical protein GT043_19505, partial [Streptomyces sp. SID2131]|nr:hypothetical protein [Streptomyces sp. SID2131]